MKEIKSTGILKVVLFPLLICSVIVNAIPLITWYRIQKNIKDKVFTGTARFGIGMTLVPVNYILITVISLFLTNIIIATGMFLFCLTSFPLRARIQKL